MLLELSSIAVTHWRHVRSTETLAGYLLAESPFSGSSFFSHVFLPRPLTSLIHLILSYISVVKLNFAWKPTLFSFSSHCHLGSPCARSLSKGQFDQTGTCRAQDFSERAGWLFCPCNTAVLPSLCCRAGPSRKAPSQDGACSKPVEFKAKDHERQNRFAAHKKLVRYSGSKLTLWDNEPIVTYNDIIPQRLDFIRTLLCSQGFHRAAASPAPCCCCCPPCLKAWNSPAYGLWAWGGGEVMEMLNFG